jgi:hypothetical protein
MRAEEDFLTIEELEPLLARLQQACEVLDQITIREVLADAIGGFVSKEIPSDPLLDVPPFAVSAEASRPNVLPFARG